jgi:hypothetical protein
MAKPFNFELGVFDATFPGITLHFPNEAIWGNSRAINASIESMLDQQIRTRNPDLGNQDISREQVRQHILESPDLMEAEVSRALRQRLTEVPEEAVANLAGASVHVHERRHFHDWLLSPCFAAMNAMRIEVSLQYRMLSPFWLDGRVTVLPVPLPRWLRKTAAERSELLQMWQSLLGDAVQVRVPEFTQSDALDAIAHVERRYNSMRVLFQSYGAPGLSAAAPLEASALCMQTQTLHDMYGAEASAEFFQTMVAQQGSPYDWFVKGVAASSPQGVPLELKSVTRLATWCLLGCATLDNEHANPVTRMIHMATEYLKQHGMPKPEISARELFAALDRSFGAAPYEQCLAHSVKICESALDTFKSYAADPQASNYVKGLAQTYELFFEWHRYMAATFFKDPDSYADPLGYLDRSLAKWPEPPVRFSFGRPFFAVPRADLYRYSRPKLFEAESTAQIVYLREFLGPEDQQSFDNQHADNWEYLCSKSDLVFAEFNRDRSGLDFYREELQKNGVRALEVLD